MILSLCSRPEIMKVMKLVKIAIWIVRISVPVLLIFNGCKTFMAHITSNDDLSKPLKKFVIMIAAGICVFFIPTLIKIILHLTNSSLEGCLSGLMINLMG